MLELLAPGGSLEGLSMVINAGADAVYLGGTRFGARAYAKNLEEKELLQALDLCHLRGRKLYLTVNTLLKETELEKELYAFLLPLYEHGLDAVLVQDIGVLRFLHRNLPDLPLHASTQMTITGVGGADLLKKYGVTRLVPARELSLPELEQLHRETGMELECFVHGALCYCYSGQCLFSSLIGGRSGNRGRCAQPCRQPYDLFLGQRSLTQKDDRYLLSLKDLCTLRLLPKLIGAGVASFKIEGRMKRPEYAAGVTEVYRKYLDMYEKQGNFEVEEEDIRKLQDLYNRGGFTEGYYEKGNGREMMSLRRPNHQGTPAAVAVGSSKEGIRVRALEPLWENDVLELTGGFPDTQALSKSAQAAGHKRSRTSPKSERSKVKPSHSGTSRSLAKLSDMKTGAAERQEENLTLTVPADVREGEEIFLSLWGTGKIRTQAAVLAVPGQVLARVRCEKLLEEIRKRCLGAGEKIPIRGTCSLSRGEPVRLIVYGCGQEAYAQGVGPSPAQTHPLTREEVVRQLQKTGATPFAWEDLQLELEDGLFYPLQGLNELRREALTRLQENILLPFYRKAPEHAALGSPEAVSSDRKMRTGSEESSFPGFPMNQEYVRPTLRAYAETAEQFLALLDEPSLEGIYLDCHLFAEDAGCDLTFAQAARELHSRGKRCFLVLPMIWREPIKRTFERIFSQQALESADGFLLRSLEQLACMRRYAGKKEMIADYCVYTYNREARAFLRENGIDRDTLSLEENSRELALRGCKGSEAVIYGSLPLMVTAQCLYKNTQGCDRAAHVLCLKDRLGASFPVRCRCFGCMDVSCSSSSLTGGYPSPGQCCMNVIYNSVPLDLLPCGDEVLRLGVSSLRLQFTFETGEEAREIVRKAAGVFLEGEPPLAAVKKGTRGHFKRGVE